MNWNKQSLSVAAFVIGREVVLVKLYELAGPPVEFGCELSNVFSDLRCAATFLVVIAA